MIPPLVLVELVRVRPQIPVVGLPLLFLNFPVGVALLPPAMHAMLHREVPRMAIPELPLEFLTHRLRIVVLRLHPLVLTTGVLDPAAALHLPWRSRFVQIRLMPVLRLLLLEVTALLLLRTRVMIVLVLLPDLLLLDSRLVIPPIVRIGLAIAMFRTMSGEIMPPRLEATVFMKVIPPLPMAPTAHGPRWLEASELLATPVVI